MAHLTLQPSTALISLTFKKKLNWVNLGEYHLVR